jgi:hypothetical protein
VDATLDWQCDTSARLAFHRQAVADERITPLDMVMMASTNVGHLAGTSTIGNNPDANAEVDVVANDAVDVDSVHCNARAISAFAHTGVFSAELPNVDSAALDSVSNSSGSIVDSVK